MQQPKQDVHHRRYSPAQLVFVGAVQPLDLVAGGAAWQAALQQRCAALPTRAAGVRRRRLRAMFAKSQKSTLQFFFMISSWRTMI